LNINKKNKVIASFSMDCCTDPMQNKILLKNISIIFSLIIAFFSTPFIWAKQLIKISANSIFDNFLIKKKTIFLSSKYLIVFWLGGMLMVLPQYMTGQTSQTYTSSDLFTVPVGITQITVECWGGGGGGGASQQGNNLGKSRGGGGGAYARSVLMVQPGVIYNVVVGTGGQGGINVADGSNGNPSLFGDNLVRAEGGTGGTTSLSGSGGIGGTTSNSIGDIKFSGGNASSGGGGGAGSNGAGGNASGDTGGTGTSNGGGNGGTTSFTEANGNPGFNYGGGGSGGHKTSNGTKLNGGNGASGKVVISWCDIPIISNQPVNTAVTYGSNATFSVTSSTSGVTYQWQVKSSEITGWADISGATNSSLTLTMPSVAMSGYQYRCKVSLSCGSYTLTNAAILTVNKKPLIVTAGNQTVVYGTPTAVVLQNGSYSVTGFVFGEDISVIRKIFTISYSTNYTETTNAGSSGIIITPVVEGVESDNYSFTTFDGTITINPADQFIYFEPLPLDVPLSEFTTPVPVNAITSSGLPVTITIDPSSPATLNGTPGNYYLSNIGNTGTVTLYANQTGNTNYKAAAEVIQSMDVTKSNQAIGFPEISDLTYSTGLTILLAATASSGLPVSYTVSSGPATVSGSVLSVTGTGEIWVTAHQPGNSNYNTAASVTQSFFVAKGMQIITIHIPSGNLTENTQITATSTSGLKVTLTLGEGSAANGITDHGMYYTLTGIGSTGLIYLVGNQAGDANFLPADVTVQTIDLSKQNQTITFNSISDQIYSSSSSINLLATASSELPIAYSVISGPATVSGSTLNISGAGTVAVTASQDGNNTFNAAPPVTQQFEVFKAIPEIIQTDFVKTYGDAPFQITPVSSSTGTFRFISSNFQVFTMVGNVATVNGVGTANLIITQDPDSNYEGASKTVIFTVNKSNSIVTVTGNTNYIFSGSPQGPDQANVTGSAGLVTYTYNGTGSTIYSPTSAKPTSAGTYSATAVVAGDENYNGATSPPFAFSISKAEANIYINNYEFTYDGSEHTATGTATGINSGNLEGLNLNATTHTNAGTYYDTWTFTDVTGNYNNTSGNVTNVINTKALIINASNQKKCFGELFSFTGTEFTSAGLVTGETIGTVTLISSGTSADAAAGDHYIIPSNATGGSFTSANYSISYQNGQMTVNLLPTLSGASQAVSVCEGSTTTINLTGLLPDKIFSLEYSINGVAQTTQTGLVSNSSGNSSFTTPFLSVENNGQILQITKITFASELPSCSQTFDQDVILSVNPNPTLTGALQVANACAGTGANISLSGLIPNSVFTVYYTINNVDKSPVTGIIADGTGNASFTTEPLTSANNGQILQIYGLEITNKTPSCFQNFIQNVILAVDPTSIGGTALATPVSVCSGNSSTITLTGYTGAIQWQQSADGTTGWANVTGGSGANTATYITPNLSTTTFYRAMVTSGVCSATPSTAASVIINPLPTITLSSNNAEVCFGDVLTSFAYSSTTGNPSQYSINFNAIAEGQGFTNVTNAALAGGIIEITVPVTGAADTYEAVLTVNNSVTGCESAVYNIEIIIHPLPDTSDIQTN
jgi:hypothetical protein